MDKEYYLYRDMALDISKLGDDDKVREYLRGSTVCITKNDIYEARYNLYAHIMDGGDRETELNNLAAQEMYIDNALTVYKGDKIYNMIAAKIKEGEAKDGDDTITG